MDGLNLFYTPPPRARVGIHKMDVLHGWGIHRDTCPRGGAFVGIRIRSDIWAFVKLQEGENSC